MIKKLLIFNRKGSGSKICRHVAASLSFFVVQNVKALALYINHNANIKHCIIYANKKDANLYLFFINIFK